jgi:predicted dehydrogenase
MNLSPTDKTTRRDFLKTSGQVAAASALAGVVIPHVHAADDETIRVALIGCGGRGTGAAADALRAKRGPLKLVAMADVFPERMAGSFRGLKGEFKDKVDVPEERKFLGLDSYKHAMDCLRPGDIAIFATPPGFRWVHFTYAIEKGLNVFMEKPVTVDGPTSKRMIALSAEADKKNLKVGVGLMVRHCRGRRQLFDRIQNGEIGDLIAMRAYRMHAPVGYAFSDPKPEGISDLRYQIQRFHSFLWASGGLFSDFYIHQIDECCWMKNAWPVQAHATGGRHYRGDKVDQNFDNYSVEYTFEDGSKFFLYGRTMFGCNDNFSSFAHGSKGMAIVSDSSHSPGKVRTYRSQTPRNADLIWRFPQPEPNPYQLEWDDLVEAIRDDLPYNETVRGVEASLVTSMGRMAAHTGQIVTYDEIFNSDHEFAPGLDTLTEDSPAPLIADANGKYPIPMPGIVKNREY